MQRLPVTAAAYRDGLLSAGQREVLAAVLDDERLVEIFASHEEDLIPYPARLTVPHLSRAMKGWKLRAAPEPTEPREPEREPYMSQTLGDRYELQGSFDAEGGSLIATALRPCSRSLAQALRPATTRPGRRAPKGIAVVASFPGRLGYA